VFPNFWTGFVSPFLYAKAKRTCANGNAWNVTAIQGRAGLLESRQPVLTAELQLSDLNTELNDLLGLPLEPTISGPVERVTVNKQDGLSGTVIIVDKFGRRIVPTGYQQSLSFTTVDPNGRCVFCKKRSQLGREATADLV
jgi:hypothetical protein